MRTILMASLIGLGGTGALASEPEAREWKTPDGTLVKYRLSAPATIEAGKTYPLVLFMHGAGERGSDNEAQLKHVPIWAFHGDADNVVPVRTTREMIESLEKTGATPKVTYYPKIGHDSWTRTYSDPEVIRWLFSQRAK